MHLIVDGYTENKEILKDERALRALLDRLPSRIKMTKISEPFITRYVGSVPEDWGISGFVIIAESHIAVHTFVERRYVNIDVFSCKDFDVNWVSDTLKDQFQLKEARCQLIDRDWTTFVPSELNKVYEPVVLDERQR